MVVLFINNSLFLTRERFFTFFTMSYPGYSSIFNYIIIVIIIPSIPCVTSLLIHTVLLPKTPTKLLVMLALLSPSPSFIFYGHKSYRST